MGFVTVIYCRHANISARTIVASEHEVTTTQLVAFVFLFIVYVAEVREVKDYRSQLSPTEFNEVLNEEWEGRKKSEIFFYTRISDFFKTNFPNIKIASEVERDLLIEELRRSRSWAQTHSIIAKLLTRSEFSAVQIEQLVQIAQSNNQIAWIIGDPDVHSFYSSLLKFESKLSTEVATELKALVKKGAPDENGDDDIPL